jgi:hypothetical protein
VGLGLGIAGLPLVLAVPLLRHLSLPTEVMLEEASMDRYTLAPGRLAAAFLGEPWSTAEPLDFPSWETPIFLGVGAVLLAVVGAVVLGTGRRERANRATARVLLVAGGVCVALAFGPGFGLYRWLALTIPGFGNGRVPLRWLFITTFAVAVLAGAGVSALVTRGFGRGGADRSVRRAGLAAAAVVALAAGAPPWGDGAPSVGTRLTWLLAGGLVVVAGGIVMRRPGAPRVVAAGVLAVAVVVIELGVPARAGYARTLRTPQSFVDRASATDTFLAAQGARALFVGRTDVNANLTHGWRTLDGYDGGLWLTDSYVAAAQRLSDRPFEPLRRLAEQIRVPLDGDALARAGIRYAVIDPVWGATQEHGRPVSDDAIDAERRRLVAGWRGPVLTDGSREVWENPGFTGEAIVYPEAATSAAPRDGRPAELRRPEPGALDVATDGAGGRLVVAEQALPGWEVTVDDGPAQLVDVDGFALAVDVPPGRHDVRFRYRPPGFAAGVAVSLVSLAVTGALLVAGRARRRPDARIPAP